MIPRQRNLGLENAMSPPTITNGKGGERSTQITKRVRAEREAGLVWTPYPPPCCVVSPLDTVGSDGPEKAYNKNTNAEKLQGDTSDENLQKIICNNNGRTPMTNEAHGNTRAGRIPARYPEQPQTLNNHKPQTFVRDEDKTMEAASISADVLMVERPRAENAEKRVERPRAENAEKAVKRPRAESAGRAGRERNARKKRVGWRDSRTRGEAGMGER